MLQSAPAPPKRRHGERLSRRRHGRVLGSRIEQLEDRRLLSADLADPVDGQVIDPLVLNSRGFLDVTLSDTDGRGLNVADITDPGDEFTLSGAAAAGVLVDGAATLVTGTTYRYTFVGNFGNGTVTVDFVAGSYSDQSGNLNAAETETFTVGANEQETVPSETTLPDVPTGRVREEGFPCGYDPARHDRFFDFRNEPVPNPDFFLAHHDLSGIAWRLNYRNLPVLISPQHFIFAAHVGITENTAIRFMNRDGEILSLATVELIPIPGSDLKIGKLNRPMTPQDKVTSYPILSSVAEAHVGREILFFKTEMRAGTSWTTDLTFINGQPLGIRVNPHYVQGGNSFDSAFAVRGDSGDPSFIEHEGRLALVGIHSDDGEDKLVAPFVDEINAILAEDGFALDILMDREIVAGPHSLFFGEDVLDGQPPASLVGETVGQKQEIVIHNFTNTDEIIELATDHPFFRPDVSAVMVPAEGSVTVRVAFESDTVGEHAGTLLLEGEKTKISIALLGHHKPESFTQIDPRFLPERGKSNCVWGDYDNDGDMDVVCTKPGGARGSPSEVNIYRNDGRGTFVEVLPSLMGLSGPYAWGDFDGDEDLDLVVTGTADGDEAGLGPVTKVYRNDGNDAFVELDTEIPGVTQGRVVWVDYDVDGDLDLHVVQQVSALSIASGRLISRLYRNDGAGRFVESDVSFLPLRNPDVFWGDYDNDGDPDLLTVGWDRQWVHRSIIYRNDGDGEFHELHNSLNGLTSTHGWADFDNDGDLDVLPSGIPTTSDSHDIDTVRIFRNAGDGTFQEFETNLPQATGGVHWGDYDSDGDLDAFLWGQINDHGCSVLVTRIYRNDAAGTFVDIEAPLLRTPWVRSYIGGNVMWGDYEGDGHPDLLMNGLVLRNNATFDFPPPPDAVPPAGDANRDFRFDQLDIVQTLQAAKYKSSEPATWEEGDWNADGVFNQLDIVLALQAGRYLLGPHAVRVVDIAFADAGTESDVPELFEREAHVLTWRIS